MGTETEVAELLEERPDLEPALEAVLEPDPPWDFHDVDVDSGRFGELVGRDLVEKTEQGYHVPDRQAIERALNAEAPSTTQPTEFTFPKPSITADRLEIGLLLGALALVVGFRLLSWPTVFRQGHVVLSGNDPYFYRFLVERLLENPELSAANLPGSTARGEPWFVVSLWLVSVLFGGSSAVAGHVLAWYPVATAALSAGLVYGCTTLITDDRRIGLAAVTMLAVIPGHALRTGLGFADHHAFDYVWLVLTLLGIVLIAAQGHRNAPVRSPRTLLGSLLVALGVAGQTLAWEAGPLLLVVLGPYVALETLRAVRANTSPLRTAGPIVVGIAIGAILSWTAHDALGWHTELVAGTPTVIALVAIALIAAGELFYRFDYPAQALAGIEAVVFLIGWYLFQRLRPDDWARLQSSLENRLLAPRPIAEVQSIFSDSFGWLLLFGFVLVLALPYLVWASYRAMDDARWLPPVTYAWYFLVLSGIQARFVGELSPVIAIFAGLGLVHLAERIDVARRPAPFTDAAPPDLRLPEPRQAGYLALLFLLVAGLSILQVPVMTALVTTTPGLSDTAFYLADRSDDRGLEYPENYVFSTWDKNRVYNYFVNGESRSYGYARSNFDQFLVSTDPPGWYDRLSPRRFVVATDRAAEAEPDQLGTLLYTHHGSRTDDHPGLAHYRLVYVADTGGYKAFELVEGAVLRGQASPDATVIANTTVEAPGATFTYTRETTANATGNYTLRVAYPGRYEVNGATVSVTEAAVWNGTTVAVDGSANP